MQQPLKRKWPLSQKASEGGGLQRDNCSTADGHQRKNIRTNHSPADGLCRKKESERGGLHATTTQPQMACIAQTIRTRGLQRNNHSAADGLYRKKHPNEEACNATTTQPQMACIAKSIRTRRPATQQPLNHRWPESQKASERGGLQRNNHSTADGLHSKKHPNEEACNATTTQPKKACIAKCIRTRRPATHQPLTAEVLYRKKHPNEEACNATTAQPQMACIAKSIQARRPAMQQPLNRRWPA